MRISAKDRRSLVRRLKNRLPPALQAAITFAPRIPQFILFVTATVVLTPQAMARIKANEATPVFTPSLPFPEESPTETPEAISMSLSAPSVTPEVDENRVKTYKKEELSLKLPPNPVAKFGDRLIAEMTSVIQTITSQQSATAERGAVNKLRSTEPDGKTWRLNQAFLGEAPKQRKTDINAVRLYLSGEAQQAGSSKAKSFIPGLDKFAAGASFDADFKSMFAGLTSGTDSPVGSSGSVRYGLVLQDIVPSREASDRVAIANAADELQYAGHADVQWTIGPVSEDGSRKIFAFPDQASAAPEPKKDDESFWSRIRLPKMAWTGKATPDAIQNLSKLKKDALPNWKVQTGQSEGYLTLNYTMSTSGKKLAQQEEIKIPVAGTLAVGRRFDDRWNAVQSSAYNILVDQRLPLVSVHYMHLEERVMGDVGLPISKTETVSAAGKGRAKGVVAKEADRPEAYSLNYTKTF